MFIIRPVTQGDVDQLMELASLTSFGLTTLPRDRALLERRVRESERSFARPHGEPVGGEDYLMVMEDTASQRIMGTAAVVAKVGGFEPFYAFRIKKSVFESKMLGVRKEIATLNLVTEHNGPCEIGSLFLHPEARGGGHGRALSMSRFLLMACFPTRFDPMVIAEMRGVIDRQGHSPFWDAVGKHFFDLDFPKADYLSIVNKQFIGELMPPDPIYIPLLPLEAQAVIGKTHDDTSPALAILQAQGFAITDMVDIFESGPIVRCALEKIRAVEKSRVEEVAAIRDGVASSTRFVISNTRLAFRACQGMLECQDGQVTLDRETANALDVAVGDEVRYVALRA